MREYWNRPEDTVHVFTSDGFLRTGDIATIDEKGFVRIVDRKKDMILVSGFNVFPNEVEDVVASHPGVLEVAAVGVPDERAGEAVKVFIVRKDPSLTREMIIAHCRESLTAYKVPHLATSCRRRMSGRSCGACCGTGRPERAARVVLVFSSDPWLESGALIPDICNAMTHLVLSLAVVLPVRVVASVGRRAS